MEFLYFLKVDIIVKDRQMPNFISYTERLLPIVQAKTPWKLIAALSAVTGVPNTIVHLWQIPSADSLLEEMDFFASDPLQNLYPPLLGCCKKQTQELYTSMPYNPLGINKPRPQFFRSPRKQKRK